MRGFAVRDETAVSMGIADPTRVRSIDAELIDGARAAQVPPLDALAMFTIYAAARDSAYSDVVRPERRTLGRLLDGRTGPLIGSFEVDGLEMPSLPVGCDRGGLSRAFVIRFDAFDTNEVSAQGVQERPCVQSALRCAPPASRPRTGAGPARTARLNRNPRLTLEHMGVKGQVRLTGNAFVVPKVVTR